MKITSLSETVSKVTDQELAKIVGRHYKLFRELHPDRKFSLLELASRTGKDPGNLSKLITSLERKEIVETEEVERERGRPFRYVRLSSKVASIISSIIDAVKPMSEPKYEPLTIDLCLDVMEDVGLDEETRKIYANSLHSRFTSMPEKILREHERLRVILEEVLRNPPTDGEIGERKRSMIRMSLPRLTLDGSTREWVFNHVYPNALKILEDETKPETIVTWAISMLEDMGMRSPEPRVRNEIKTKLRGMYFNEAIKPNSRVAEELLDAILRMFCQESKSARELTNYLRERAKSSKGTEREKATLLLKKIVGYLPP